ncbi:phosphate regulon transcriptional regulator PhoB [Sphingosinicella terrae]|uniref:phosphate regulon transcriptional regulator PhoB n=1 Tax=Sphingosinicella terrae TaxID=2172047 RepID=UPI000E0DF06C|nr:phosphate regulon transcriptional regulator PhoB [Sphingosinicella terrae]
MKPRLLLVEDDPGLIELLRWHLEREAFEVAQTPDGEEALMLAKESPPDVILLDWMIEGISGIEVCRRLRRTPGTAGVPIIMITGRDEEGDRICGLETGADDYVTKPFSPRELIARIGAVMRRSRGAPAAEELRFADLEMDLARHRVRRSGRNVPLGPTEFRLLRQLMENPRRVFSRERLLDLVWGRDKEIEVRTVDVHVRRLRQALGANGRPELIRTVRQAGYALDDEVA